jgi:hypothetical protein
MEPIKVFLSSTCYDLKQIRSDMFDFLSNMGFIPILSEYSNFPINPDKNTVDNCLENVKNNTDILVLIIGKRYGFQIDGDKSITNTEYSYAKSLGIPSYIFIEKQLMSVLPVWEKNKGGDFSNIVDTPKVFEFVTSIKNTEQRWCFEFETAQDIANILRVQFSHLFKESLLLHRKFTTNLPDFYYKLTPQAINILLKKEEYYEPLFFAQVLEDELNKFEELKLDLDFNIRFGSKEKISDVFELHSWLTRNMTSLNNYISTSENLMNKAFQQYFGDPGVPADLEGLHYVACALARLFKELIDWHNSVISTSVQEDHILLRDSFARYTVDSALKIWDYPKMIKDEIRRGIESIKTDPSKSITLQITLKLDVENEAKDTFTREIQRLTEELE